MILIRVDLPAPFSPSSAWISPRRSSRETSSSASVAPNCFETCTISSTGRFSPGAGTASSSDRSTAGWTIPLASPVRVEASTPRFP